MSFGEISLVLLILYVLGNFTKIIALIIKGYRKYKDLVKKNANESLKMIMFFIKNTKKNIIRIMNMSLNMSLNMKKMVVMVMVITHS